MFPDGGEAEPAAGVNPAMLVAVLGVGLAAEGWNGERA